MEVAKRNTKFYRAGTNKGPQITVNCNDEVWLFTDTVFFVQQGGECLNVSCGTSPKVQLWEVNVSQCKKAKKHSQFDGIYICSSVDKPKVIKELEALPWTKAKEIAFGEVTSLLDASVLRQVVRKYLKSNPPKNATDVNSQAELKAVSHWRWLKNCERKEFLPGPHDDPRLKKAAQFVFKTWNDELLQEEQPPSKRERMDIGSGSSKADIISDLKEGIFFLKMYYNLGMPRKDDERYKREAKVTVIEAPGEEHSSGNKDYAPNQVTKSVQTTPQQRLDGKLHSEKEIPLKRRYYYPTEVSQY